ncbi:hypothetical protein THAOC_32754, partial [Thalassiosira oceanica]
MRYEVAPRGRGRDAGDDVRGRALLRGELPGVRRAGRRGVAGRGGTGGPERERKDAGGTSDADGPSERPGRVVDPGTRRPPPPGPGRRAPPHGGGGGWTGRVGRKREGGGDTDEREGRAGGEPDAAEGEEEEVRRGPGQGGAPAAYPGADGYAPLHGAPLYGAPPAVASYQGETAAGP